MANYELNKFTKKGWTKQPNAILKDKDLTSDAKVVLYSLLSISGDYHISESGIASTVNLSLDRVKKAIKILKSTGYIEVSKVMHNYRLNGYIWKISDTNGTYRKCDFREMENPATENPATENTSDGISSDRETQRPKTRLTENPSIYEYIEQNEQTNHEEQKIEHTEWDERPPHQPDVEEAEAKTLPPYNLSSFTESSSVANAPSPANKNSSQAQVITQREFEFQQFLKKYPKKPTGTDMEATKQAFFEATDLDGSFAEIMAGLDAWCNSVDWTKEGGRYITKPLHFLTTRKWEEVPRTINTEIDPGFIEYLNSAKRAEELGL